MQIKFKGAKMREEIKRTILKVAGKYGIKVEKIILFGSRARGDYREDSDWDVLIVTERKLDKKTEENFWLETKRELVFRGIIPEIIIASRDEVEKYRNLRGFVYHHALTEGVTL